MRQGWFGVVALAGLLVVAGCPVDDDDAAGDDDVSGDDDTGDDDTGDDDATRDDETGDEDTGDDDTGDDDATGDDDTGDDDDSGPWEDPVEVLDEYDGPTFAELLEVETWGDWIVFCSGVQGLQLYDASDPEDLTLLDNTGFGGIGGFPRCQHVAPEANGTRVYVSTHLDATQPYSFLAVIDASNPNQLEEVGFSPRDEEVEGLDIAGDHLLVTAHEAGLLVFDRGPGGELDEVTRLEDIGNARDVRVAGDLAYLVDGDGWLVVIDISDPEDPVELDRLSLPGSPRDVALDGDRAFVALGSDGLALVSLDDPEAPSLIDVEDTPGSALAVDWGASANAIYVGDWNDIRVFDLTDRDDARLIGREPLDLGYGSDSRTLGIAGRDDVIFSSNWTEMVSYRYTPGREAPDLVATPSTLSLADAGPGDPSSALLQLRNDGSKTLYLEGVNTPAEITVGSLPATLGVGESTNVLVTLEPLDTGSYNGEISFESNDPDQGTLGVNIRANLPGIGIGDPVPDVTFVDLDGNLINTADMAGDVYLLAYFATF